MTYMVNELRSQNASREASVQTRRSLRLTGYETGLRCRGMGRLANRQRASLYDCYAVH